ncbi:MAG: response regulator [Deltaproteobacteria bacterium]|nr:response regulator [Deltaproteobacteria bacterium]MBW1962326.1 response regulator [Deltaproteobacteria bacterium]MBW2150568.1 response regulator [Deltaproteobacteria bacterium]
MGNSNKILIIDDEAPIRRVVALKLQKSGYPVITARNGEEGLRIIQDQKPAVVITDINMPKLDGKHLCEKTRALTEGGDILIIILSGQISPDDNRWVKDMKNAEFMPKPFSPSRLLNRIEQYFDVRE